MLHENNMSSLAQLFAEDPARDADFSCSQLGWWLGFAGVPLSRTELGDLYAEIDRTGLSAAVEALFAGEPVNTSENQPALHMALRAAEPQHWPNADPDGQLHGQREAFLNLAEALHDGRQGLSDLIHIGIGGSDLGPRLVADALDCDDGAVRVHWLSTLDGRRLARLLRQLDPGRTGVVIASKSFGTEETLVQAEAVRDWLGQHFATQAWAATARPDRAAAFGIHPAQVLAFPSWTGGRFSLWSSVGVSAAACIGADRFRQLLAGAARADAAFRSVSPTGPGLAVVLALLLHHLRRGLGLGTLGVVAYEPRLALLGDYLQQLVMESLGKNVDLDHRPLQQPSSPLIYGGRGTDLQHSIFQALHQGTDTHPLLLVGSLNDEASRPDWQRRQQSHLFAQALAFAAGRHDGRPWQHLPGNRPVMMLISESLDAYGLGALLATFEHAVYALARLWGINAFDQWGVEEGKLLAASIGPRLAAAPPSLDQLPALLAELRRARGDG